MSRPPFPAAVSPKAPSAGSVATVESSTDAPSVKRHFDPLRSVPASPVPSLTPSAYQLGSGSGESG